MIDIHRGNIVSEQYPLAPVTRGKPFLKNPESMAHKPLNSPKLP
jgi:hypothetical protein